MSAAGKRRAAKGPWSGQVAGYYADTIPFFKERDISFAAMDTEHGRSPRPGWGAEQGIPGNPIHHALLGWLGAGIVENLDLENLAATARKLKRYEFMLMFAPFAEGGAARQSIQSRCFDARAVYEEIPRS